MTRLDTFCEDFIREDVEAGFLVIVPERNIQFEQWHGIGWIRLNRQTGVSNYFICGGLVLAGGGTAKPAAITREMARSLSRELRCLVETAVRIFAFEIVGIFGVFLIVTGNTVFLVALTLTPPPAAVIAAAAGLQLTALGVFLVGISIREHLEERKRVGRC